MGAQGLGSRAIIGTFYNKLDQYMAASWIDKVSMLFDSDQETETYPWLGHSPMLREWVGGRNAKGFSENKLSITNKSFEATLIVLLKEIKRDKTGQVMIRIAELAARAGGHWGKLLSTLIANGTGSTSGFCYDGQYFFDDDHSEGDSGTQKNLLTATEVAALNVATAAAPTPVEAAKAILGVIGYMLTYKDNQGEPMNANAKSFLVMTSPVLWQFLAPAIYNPLVSSGETNSLISVVANSGFTIDVVANPYLTYTTQFVTMITDRDTAPFIRQEEDKIHMSKQAEGSAEEFNNKRHLYGVDASRNVGYGRWQQASHATLS